MTDRGVALLVVLWVMLVLSALGLGIAAGVRSEVKSAHLALDDERGWALASAGIEKVIAELLLDDRSVDYRGEQWRLQYVDPGVSGRGGEPGLRRVEVLDADGELAGYFTVRIVDESGKFFLNTAAVSPEVKRDILARLLEETPAEDPGAVADCIVDWLDADDEERRDGAELEWYASLDEGVVPRNGAIPVMEELLLVRLVRDNAAIIYGDPEAGLPGLADFVTLYDEGGLNVNAAPAAVLESALDIDEREALRVMDVRDGRDDTPGTADDVALDGAEALELDKLTIDPYRRLRSAVKFTTEYFTLEATGELPDGYSRTLVAVVHRLKDGCEVVSWRRR